MEQCYKPETNSYLIRDEVRMNYKVELDPMGNALHLEINCVDAYGRHMVEDYHGKEADEIYTKVFFRRHGKFE